MTSPLRSQIPAMSAPGGGLPISVGGTILGMRVTPYSFAPPTDSLLSGPTTVLSGSVATAARVDYFPATDETIDARTYELIRSGGSTVLRVGDSASTAKDVSWVGGIFRTTGDPTWTNTYWYNSYLPAGGHTLEIDLRTTPTLIVIDGMRLTNGTDGFRVDGINSRHLFRNCWITGMHDDAMEDDIKAPLGVFDCLLDDVWSGVSTIVGSWTPWTYSASGQRRVVMERTLMGMGIQPASPGVEGHSEFFKLENGGPQNDVAYDLRDCVFYAPKPLAGATLDFPPALSLQGAPSTAERCIVVWGGDGDYPGTLLPGVEVTTDISVWEDAKAAWKTRHGLAAGADILDPIVDWDAMLNPDPWRRTW